MRGRPPGGRLFDPLCGDGKWQQEQYREAYFFHKAQRRKLQYEGKAVAVP
jgi:hypothetical protein